jgi:hypothetical protein
MVPCPPNNFVNTVILRLPSVMIWVESFSPATRNYGDEIRSSDTRVDASPAARHRSNCEVMIA